ncbi:multiheme c-type cytochrome [candidate division KSB1 bacterium]
MRLKWICLFAVFIIVIFCVLPASNYAVQDMENPCFFCHADLFFELKDGTHEKSGIDCFACHGESKEHAIAEDNRIKPEKIFTRSDAAEFCGNCHDKELKDFSLSTHFKSITKNVPTCIDCHKGHEFEKKIDRKICLICHGNNSDRNKSSLIICEDDIKMYQVHSLGKIKNN